MKLRTLAAVLAAIALSLTAPAVAHAETDVYANPGVHHVNGRYWKTTCSHYSSSVVRCTTDIYATRVFLENGRWYKQNNWVFNNLSYLPSSRGQWAGNPLGQTGSWTTTDGRRWRTECDTAATGRGACRNYLVATVASEQGGAVKQSTAEVFNSMVRFSTASLPAVTSIPAPTETVSAPAPGAKTPLRAAAATPRPNTPKPSPVATSQQQAIRMANQYLEYMGFSRSGLIEQLVYEGFSKADATYAVDHIRIDWNKQAAIVAENYLDLTAFSREGLIDQLLFEGFTAEQASYGARAVGL